MLPLLLSRSASLALLCALVLFKPRFAAAVLPCDLVVVGEEMEQGRKKSSPLSSSSLKGSRLGIERLEDAGRDWVFRMLLFVPGRRPAADRWG